MTARLLIITLLGCTESGGMTPSTDAAAECGSDDACDDGRDCNGTERCFEGRCGPGEAMDCDDSDACTADSCAERVGCVHLTMDADRDGHAPESCGGDDCDDLDGNRFAGNAELCDAANLDEDCDDSTFGDRDADRDGHVDARCCNGDRCGDDCDDNQPAAHPGEAEECDTIDNDCDSSVDEGVRATLYVDADLDGFGAMDSAPVEACFETRGLVTRQGDCDDTDPALNPGLPEQCDALGRDDDCDGAANPESICSCSGSESRACVDGEGTRLAGRCAAGVERCVEGMFTACTISPTNEVCDGTADEDCDGSVDEGLTVACFPDTDNDGYALMSATPVEVCPRLDGSCPTGTTARSPAESSDCDDLLGSRRPGAPERTDNLVDDDCDGATDEAMGG